MKKGWQMRKLGDVCRFDKAQGNHRGLPYVGLEHIESDTARFIGSSEAQPVKSSTFRFSDEHVLYGRLRPYLNKALAPDFEGHCSTEIFPLKPSPELSREYLLFWLLSDETCDRINATCTGARMPRAQMNDVLDFKIPVPPLPEQQRIVGLLDEAFEGLATAKANAEKNLQNARALFESHLQSVFSQRGPGWVEKPLSELCESSRVITYGVIKLGDETPNGVPCLRTSNVRWLRIETEGMKRITPALSSEYFRTILKGGEVLVNVRGTLGGVAVVGAEMAGWNVSREVAVVPVDRGRINPSFLSYFIGSGVSQQWLGGVKKGAAYIGINIEDLRLFPVAAPKLAEQSQVVAHLDVLWTETQRLARLYEQKLAALAALKKSLLHRAFAGEL